MRVVVTEKPSVARDLGRVLGVNGKRRGYLEGAGLCITWCFGHMAELEEPAHYHPEWKQWNIETLPMIPTAFAIRTREGATDQMAVIRRLLVEGRPEEVVNACDAGREGELIFRYVMELTGCRAPVKRLWVSSLTDAAIKAAWARLRPGSDFDALADAARCRAEADWLVGLNATRALTCSARRVGPAELLSVGRVQTPTLAMLVERDRAIETFVPEAFWQVKASVTAPGLAQEPRSWTAMYTRQQTDEIGRTTSGSSRPQDEDDESHDTRLGTPEVAEAVVAALAGQPGVVSLASRKSTRERPPLLYDLTSLQRRANQRYGLSAQRTLDLAQALYEKHKLITYPRTDARFLTEDQVPLLPDVLRGLLPIAPYAPFATALLAGPIRPGKRVVDPSEVGDHHAIIPTGRTPSGALTPDEKRIFDLVARRLLAALMPDARFDITLLVVEVEPGAPLPDGFGSPLCLRARGRVCRDPGWRAADPPGRNKQVELPAVEVPDAVRIDEAAAHEGATRPPKPHNDASLLGSMERAGKELDDKELARTLRKKGLGTPATRAAILQTLLDRKYARRVGKVLQATDKGRALIDALPVDELKSAELTGLWEGRLSEVADAQEPRGPFMGDIKRYTTEVVERILAAPAPELEHPEPTEPSLGDCPACGKAVRQRGKVYTCDGGRQCPFVVFGTMSKRKISARMVKELLATGQSKAVKGFKSKAGKDFVAGLTWDAERGRVGFWFPERGTDTPSPERATPPPRRASAGSGRVCPACGEGRVIRGRTRLGCSRWREGCDYAAPLPPSR